MVPFHGMAVYPGDSFSNLIYQTPTKYHYDGRGANLLLPVSELNGSDIHEHVVPLVFIITGAAMQHGGLYIDGKNLRIIITLISKICSTI